MAKLNKRQQQILLIFLQSGVLRSSEVYNRLMRAGEKFSLVTVKRELSRLVTSGFLTPAGRGRSQTYEISAAGRIFADINAKDYCAMEPDKRYGLEYFNFDLFQAMLPEIFTAHDLTVLHEATSEYRRRTADLPKAIEKKELERLIIELSWKSSKIEGNTYTLLDTEKLILENKAAHGHDKKEAVMILNHKDAFAFVREHAKKFQTLTRINLEALHKILVKDLSVGFGGRYI